MERNLSIRITGRDDAAPALKAAKAEVQALNTAVVQGNQQVAASTDRAARSSSALAVATRSGAVGVGTLRSALASLAASTVGLPGRLGEVAGIVTAFAYGNLAAAGIFMGLGALALLIKNVGEESRKARESVARFVELDPMGTRKRFANEQDRANSLSRGSEIRALLAAGGQTLKVAPDAITGRSEVFSPLREEERKKLLLELHEISNAERDYKKSLEETKGALKQLTGDVSIGYHHGVNMNVDLGRAGNSAVLGPAEAALAATKAEWARRRKMLPFGETLTAQSKAPDMAKLAEGVAENIKLGGNQIVSAMSLAANSIATGRTMLGGVGSAAGGLSALAKGAEKGDLLFGLSNPLAIAGIAFSFLDAFTSDRSKETQKQAHLEALREHDQERPPANIYINLDPFDPKNRDHQRVVDAARREAEASGYRVSVG